MRRRRIGKASAPGMLVLIALAIHALARPATAAAQTRVAAQSDSAELAFDIPRSTLRLALERYSIVTRLQILYSADLVADKQVGPLRGNFQPEVALALLLRGTGLRVRRTGTRSITLFEMASESSALPVLEIRPLRVEGPPPGPDPLHLRYAERLVAVAARALQGDAVTGRGNYTVRVRLWLAADGGVSRAQIARSSPNAAEAGEIARVLRGMTPSEPPPPGMRQPLVYDFQIGRPG